VDGGSFLWLVSWSFVPILYAVSGERRGSVRVKAKGCYSSPFLVTTTTCNKVDALITLDAALH